MSYFPFSAPEVSKFAKGHDDGRLNANTSNFDQVKAESVVTKGKINIDGQDKAFVAYTYDRTLSQMMAADGVTDNGLPGANLDVYFFYDPDQAIKCRPVQASLLPGGPVPHPDYDYPVLGVGTAAQKKWRFLGWGKTNFLAQFQANDDEYRVCSFLNPGPVRVVRTPGYVDDNADTTYSHTSASFADVNGGVGMRHRFIRHPWYDVSVLLSALYTSGASGFGIGIDQDSSVIRAAKRELAAATRQAAALSYALPGSDTLIHPGLADFGIKAVSPTNASTIYADLAREGSAADPRATFMALEYVR